MLTRIECCAFLKSLIEAKVPSTHWDDAVAKCSEIMDARATAAPSPAAPSPAAPSPAAGGVSAAELECVSIEDHGNRVRVEATGYQGGKYFTAWDKNAAAARQLDAGMKFKAEIVEKPNPKGKYPHLNLQEIKIQLDNLADVGDQPTGGKIAASDLPF